LAKYADSAREHVHIFSDETFINEFKKYIDDYFINEKKNN